jgi:hypothetical protein
VPPKCKFSNNSVSHKVASLEQNNILHQSSTLYNKPKAIYSNHIAFSSCLPIFLIKMMATHNITSFIKKLLDDQKLKATQMH